MIRTVATEKVKKSKTITSVKRELSVKDVIEMSGMQVHVLIGSAEGSRSPFDRTIASDRASRAIARLA